MNENDLKRYTVILGEGSGILFQPLDDTKMYILSAKHIFYENIKKEGGLDEKKIWNKINYYLSDEQDTPIECEIRIGENYFEHTDSDAAIIVIEKVPGFNHIFIDEHCNSFNECFLCGYPSKIHTNKNDRYSNFQINRKVITTDNGYFRLETNFGNLNYEDVLGFSGGGILRLNNNMVNVIGIQSSTISEQANGHIDVIPISKFLQIVKENNLSEMIPPFLSNFSFLKDKVFDFPAGSGEQDIAIVKLLLKQKTLEVINSEISPPFIKDHFKEKLLLNENDLSVLKEELIYITWLEFLTFLNIIKSKICTKDDLIEIQSILRLVFNMNDTEWLGENFVKDCLSYDYENLSEDGTVFIKTKNNPVKIKDYSIAKGAIVPSISVIRDSYIKGVPIYNGEGSDIFNAGSEAKEFIFDKYNFIHFEYLKYVMLVENSDEYRTYNRLNQTELLKKLKEEYGKIFGV